MQLNLFEDNRLTIRQNMADELIRSREFVRAVSVYDQIIVEFPGDKRIAASRDLVIEWLELLSGLSMHTVNSELLHSIWLRLDSIFLPSLSLVALDMLIDVMFSLTTPEQLYIPPRFHLGQVLMKAGRFAEAANSFHAALSSCSVDRGRFLAWHGDALTLAGNPGTALESYFEAFLHDPATIDMLSVKNRTIRDLHISLHFDATDEIEEQDEPAWLLVWGWFNGVFALPEQAVPSDGPPGAALFEAMLAKPSRLIPRIWFDMLVYAEKVRTVFPDSKELVAVRRLMKKTNEFMFGRYLEKVSVKR